MIARIIKNKKISLYKVTGLVWMLFLPVITYAAGTGGTGGFIPNPLDPNIDTIPKFLNALFADIVKIGAVVLAFYIVYSGYLFVSAQGNEQALQKAKDSFKWVLIGGAILLGAQVLSSAILETINTIGP